MGNRGKPGFRVWTDVRRADRKVQEELSKYPVPNIADAMNKFGAMDSGIRPLYQPIGRMVGTAITVKALPGDHLMIRKAMSMAQAGDVLVIDGGRDCSKAVWGSFVTEMVMRRGLAGAVIDGATRDLEEIRRLGFKLFARGITPTAPTFTGPGEVNVPVCCGGVVVCAGDIVVGDEEGVVVVPREDAETVLEALQAVRAKEESWRVEVDQGKIVKEEWVDEYLRSQGCSFVS